MVRVSTPGVTRVTRVTRVLLRRFFLARHAVSAV